MSGRTDQLPPGVKRHTFTRIVDFGFAPKGAVDLGGALQFNMNQLPGVAELTNTYDAYSIDKVDVTFQWVQPFASSTAANAHTPVMIVTRDYDDAEPPLSFGETCEYADAKLCPYSLHKPTYTISVEPRVATTVFRSGVTSGYSWGRKGQIIDFGNPDVPHYGLKYWNQFHNSTSFPATAIRVYGVVHFSCYAAR